MIEQGDAIAFVDNSYIFGFLFRLAVTDPSIISAHRMGEIQAATRSTDCIRGSHTPNGSHLSNEGFSSLLFSPSGPKVQTCSSHEIGTERLAGAARMALSLQGRWILLPEDQVLVALDLEAALETAGARLATTHSLREAIVLLGMYEWAGPVPDYRLARSGLHAALRVVSRTENSLIVYSDVV